MKFMSNAGVFIVIAAFAACAAGTVNMPEESSLVVQDSAGDEQTGDSLRLRLRRCDARLCEIGGCRTEDKCDGQGNCYRVRWCRMKREDFDILDAAMGVYEDEISKQIGNHRARRSSNSDLVEEDSLAAGALRHRLRRCVLTVGRDSKGNQAETKVCRMKREDYAILDAAMGVYEDAAPVGDNGESADDEQPDALSQLRLRRTVITRGCDNKKNCAGTIVGRMKREDVAPLGDNGESADDEQPELRLRRTVITVGVDNLGNRAGTIVGRMKREDVAPLGDNGESADDEQPELRLRRTVITAGVDSQGNRAGTIVGRIKRTVITTGVDSQGNRAGTIVGRMKRTVITTGVDSQGNRAGTIVGRMKRESNNCLWQCVCTTVHGGNAGVQDASSSGSRGTRGIGSWAGSNRGEALSTTVTSGRCVTESQDCRSVETC